MSEFITRFISRAVNYWPPLSENMDTTYTTWWIELFVCCSQNYKYINHVFIDLKVGLLANIVWRTVSCLESIFKDNYLYFKY